MCTAGINTGRYLQRARIRRLGRGILNYSAPAPLVNPRQGQSTMAPANSDRGSKVLRGWGDWRPSPASQRELPNVATKVPAYTVGTDSLFAGASALSFPALPRSALARSHHTQCWLDIQHEQDRAGTCCCNG